MFSFIEFSIVCISSLDVPLFEINFCFQNVLGYIISFALLWGTHSSCVSSFLNRFMAISKTAVWILIPNILGLKSDCLFSMKSICPSSLTAQVFQILRGAFLNQSIFQKGIASTWVWTKSLVYGSRENVTSQPLGLAWHWHSGSCSIRSTCGIWADSAPNLWVINGLGHLFPWGIHFCSQNDYFFPLF